MSNESKYRKKHNFWQRHVRQMLNSSSGQSLVEYVLIMTLIIMSLAVILSLAGPAVGNVFSNTVANLLNLTTTPEDPLEEDEFWDLVTAVASFTPDSAVLITNTPPPDADNDNDGYLDSADLCPNFASPINTDTDNDGIGDPCDSIDDDTGDFNDQFVVDEDGDLHLDRVCTGTNPGVTNAVNYAALPPDVTIDGTQYGVCDNCIGTANAGQEDNGDEFWYVTNDGIGNACEPPPPPATDTPGPSPTPEDEVFPYPFRDDGDEDNFETDFDTIIQGVWEAEYWNESGNSSNTPQCNGSNGSGGTFPMTVGTADVPQDTNGTPGIQDDEKVYESELVFPRSDHSSWTGTGSIPHPDLSNSDFCARYTAKFFLDGGTYTWRYLINNNNSGSSDGDRLRVYVDGDLIVDDWDGVAPSGYTEVPWTTPVTERKEYEVVVQYVDERSNHQLELYLQQDGALTDAGECNWTSVTTDEWRTGDFKTARTGANFWTDSPNNTRYAHNSFCILRLRGTIDLAGATYPFIEFWDIHRINDPPDTFWFAVREAGTTQWILKPIHNIKTASDSYVLREVNLVNYRGFYEDGSAAPETNFINKEVEVAFIIESDGNNNREGWLIDDFAIEEKFFFNYSFPFSDTMEDQALTEQTWIAEDDWRLSNAVTYGGSNFAWSDRGNNGQTYQNNENNSLTLNGLLDLTDGNAVLEPELAFYTRWEMASGDQLFVEVSTDLGETWTALRTSTTDTDDAFVTGTDSSTTFEQVRFPLDSDTIIGSGGEPQNYIGEKIMVRFRIQTNGSGQADGWYIDNIEFRNRPVTSDIFPGWCDTFDDSNSLGNWLLGGSWSLENTRAYSGSRAMSDSPGSNYVHGSNSRLELNRDVVLSAAVNPVLEFWHRWELASNDDIYVEASDDGGNNWQVIWSHEYGQNPDLYSSSVTSGNNWNDQNAYQRTLIHLFEFDSSDNLIFPDNPNNELKLRFRLDATNNSAVDDGWRIDDMCIREYDDSTVSIPWSDNLESGNGNWYVGGDWAITSEQTRSGANAFSDSPSGDYRDQADSILELRQAIDLTSLDPVDSTIPTLYYWERLNTGAYGRFFTEVIRVDDEGRALNGEVWTPLQTIFSSRRNDAFNRRQVDLSPYKGDLIRLRFRLQAMQSGSTADGVYLDFVQLVDVATEVAYPLPYTEDFELGSEAWVAEGDWQLINDQRNYGSGNVLGPGFWNADHYSLSSWPAQNTIPDWNNLTYIGSESLSEISFNWGNSAPGVVLSDGGRTNNWITRYRRTVLFDEDVQFSIHLNSDDGHRLLIDGNLVTNESANWVGCGNCRTGRDPSSGSGSHFYYTLAGGIPHTLEVHHFEWSGGAKLYVDFTPVTATSQDSGEDPFSGSAWEASYFKYCNGGLETPAWNDGSPELASFIDFDWSSEAPDVVNTNNVDPGGPPPPGIQPVNSTTFSFPAEEYSRSINATANGNSTSVEFQLRTDTGGYEGTGFMQALPDAGLIDSSANYNMPELEYDIDFPSTGTWYLWVLARGKNGSGDSYRVGMNGTPLQSGGAAVSPSSSSWQWHTDYQFSGSGRMSFNITDISSLNTLSIWAREDGIMIDHIYLSKNSNASPNATGSGPCYTGDTNENWGVRYERTISVLDTTTVTFDIDTNAGAIWSMSTAPAGGIPVTSIPSGNQVTEVFSPGSHDVVIEYIALNNNNDNRIKVEYILEGSVFHTEASGPNNYPDYYGASVMLEGTVQLPPTSNPGLTWWQRYRLGSNDALIVEVSTANGRDIYSGTEWQEVFYRYNHSSQEWRKQFVDLTAFAGQEIVIRFRLDSRNSWSTDDGWFIDDIEIVD